MFEYAKIRFNNYINENYDLENDIVKRKLKHTYNVVKMAEYISEDLSLSDEDKELSMVIALLHDIGRFAQTKLGVTNLLEATKKVNHAALGVKMLFDDNLIREFIKSDKYDEIIRKAILNHNKYILDTSSLNELEELHCKLIRDADKTDNFRVKSEGNLNTMVGISDSDIENSQVSDKIYLDFMNHKVIKKADRVNAVDYWIYYIAYIFDFNYSSGLEYIKEKDYINILIDRFKYKRADTFKKMEDIRVCAMNYINEQIKRRKVK